MADEHAKLDDLNYETFRDNFFTTLVTAAGTVPSKGSNKRRQAHPRNKLPVTGQSTSQRVAAKAGSTTNAEEKGDRSSSNNNPSELADFSDFIANEIFPSLPISLRTLSYQSLQETGSNPDAADKWSLPLTLTTLEEVVEEIPPSVNDNLVAYGLIDPPKSDLQSFISPVLNSYIASVTTPPPKWIATRTTACEICERDWVPLTYHHLIPRGVHTKVLKRGWHDEVMLNSVAWLCRACHNFVHAMATNEELAREWFTIDRICEREDVQKWALWVGKVRWKKR